MATLESLALQIKREPEAHRDDFFRKWEEFVAAFAVLRLSPQVYHSDAMSLLNFVAQTVSHYCGPQLDRVDVSGCAASDSNRPSGGKAAVGAPAAPNGSCDEPASHLGRDLCLMLIEFVKSHRKGLNGKTLKQLISTTFLLRSKRLIDIFTILPEWLSLLDLEDRDVRRRLFVFIVRDLTIVSQQIKDARVIKGIQRFIFERLQAKSLQVQLLTCCICVELHKRRIWRDSQTINSIAQCALSSNLKLVLAGAHFLLGTKNHFDAAFLALEDIEEEIAQLQDLSKQHQGQYMGAHAKKSEGRQNRIARTKKSVDKQLERRRRRLELCAVREFAAIDELHDPQKFTERLFERCRNKDVTFGARLILLQLVSILIARHRLLVPSFYGFVLKYIHHKHKLVTKILAISAQAVHCELPCDLVEPVIEQVVDQFVSEDRSNEVITVGMNTLREIASRAPLLFSKDRIAQLVEFRHIKNKSVAMATKSFINLFREKAPELLHSTLRGREAGTELTKSKKGRTSKSSQPFSSTYILSQDDFKRKNFRGPADAASDTTSSGDDADGSDEGECSDSDEDGRALSGDSDSDEWSGSDVDDDSEAGSLDVASEGESEVKDITGDDDNVDDDPSDSEADSSSSEEDDEAALLKVNPEDLTYGSKRKRAAAHSRKDAAQERLARKRQRLVAESRAGNRQSTTNEVKARNKPALMTLQSRRIKSKQTQNVAEKMATLKRHLKSLKKGNVKHKKRRR